MEHQKSKLEEIGQKLNIKTLDDWYKVNSNSVEELGGASVLRQYNQSLSQCLQSIYPQHPWHGWKFTKVGRNFWNDINNQKNFMDWVAHQLNIQSPEDWYQVKIPQIRDLGGSSLITAYYKNNLWSALNTIYPEHRWLPWRFHQVPKGHWDNRENVARYLQWFSDQAGLTSLHDWSSVTRNQLPYSLTKKYGGVIPLLSSFYPEHAWKEEIWWKNADGKRASKAQTLLLKAVQKLLPNQQIEFNYRHPHLIFAGTNREAELDLFLPELKLALEYLGEQHYTFNPFTGSPEYQQQRDNEKRKMCANAGITLIEIPFWWDRTVAAIEATIHHYRPDIVVSCKKMGQPLDASQMSSRIQEKIRMQPNFENRHPYEVRRGSKNGSFAKCRGCLRVLRDRNEPRIEIKGTFTPYGAQPHAIIYRVCLNMECLQKAIKKFQAKSSGAFVPNFENKLWVNEELKDAADWKKKEGFDGVEWKLEEKPNRS